MFSNMRPIGNDTKWNFNLNRDFASLRNTGGYIEIGPDNICIASEFKNIYEKIKNFSTRDDDVFIAAFPKTGSRWVNEMVWLIVNNLDYERAKSEPLYHRCPRLELEGLYSNFYETIKSIDDIALMKSPRCIGTHLHWSLLPDDIVNDVKYPKIIVVLRGAEDVCVSNYYQHRYLLGYKGNLDDFCQMFLAGRVPLGPFWNQVLGFWKQRHKPNILFVKYQRMVENLPSVVKDVAKFLEKNLTNEDITKLCNYLSFGSLKKNVVFNMEDVVKHYKCPINPFTRSGKVDGYNSEMSAEIIELFKKQTEEMLEGTVLTFD